MSRFEHDVVAEAIAAADDASWHGAVADERDRYRRLAEAAYWKVDELIGDEIRDAYETQLGDVEKTARGVGFTEAVDRAHDGVQAMLENAARKRWDAKTLEDVRARLAGLRSSGPH